MVSKHGDTEEMQQQQRDILLSESIFHTSANTTTLEATKLDSTDAMDQIEEMLEYFPAMPSPMPSSQPEYPEGSDLLYKFAA